MVKVTDNAKRDLGKIHAQRQAIPHPNDKTVC
jgi:hypothetical protein